MRKFIMILVLISLPWGKSIQVVEHTFSRSGLSITYLGKLSPSYFAITANNSRERVPMYLHKDTIYFTLHGYRFKVHSVKNQTLVLERR